MRAGALQQLDELERLAALGLPEWSEELTDQADPVLAELDKLMSQDPVALGHVLNYLESGNSAIVADWLRVQLTPDLSLDDQASADSIRCAGVQIPSRPALFLAHDEITVPEKKLRKLKKPWEQAPGWFFGSPQESPGTATWPLGSDGNALDFIVQIDLARASTSFGGFETTGLPDDVTLQLFVDLDVQVGPADHRVVAFPTGAGIDRSMKPPRGSDINDANPLLINPVGALTLPRVGEADTNCDEPRDRLRARLGSYADQAPYNLNMWTRTDDEPVSNSHLGYVPMARSGGYPIAAPEIWASAAQEVLGCDPDEMFVLYDGPVDPETQPVPDPDRNRFMVLIERSKMKARDFKVTYGFGY